MPPGDDFRGTPPEAAIPQPSGRTARGWRSIATFAGCRQCVASGSGDPIIGRRPIPSLVSIMPHSWLSYGARLVYVYSCGEALHEVESGLMAVGDFMAVGAASADGVL